MTTQNTTKHKLSLEITYEGNCILLPQDVTQLLEQHNRFIKNVKSKRIGDNNDSISST